MSVDNTFSIEITENTKSLLLVEGIDDAKFYYAFAKSLGIDHVVRISKVGGKSRFRPVLETIALDFHFDKIQQLGIIADADTDAKSTFLKLCNDLQHINLPVPERAYASKSGDFVQTSIGIVPDINSTGSLEHLCLNSLPDEFTQCLDDYINCRISAEKLRNRKTHQDKSLTENVLGKAKLHTYLAFGSIKRHKPASRHSPALRLGEAAEAGVWNWRSPEFSRIEKFLRNLASIS